MPTRRQAMGGVPASAHGTFRSIKTATTTLLLGLYFIAPWLRFARGPDAPDQAILVDIPGRRFYLFGLEYWPADLPLLLGVMIFAAASLFCVTSLFGRVWCGFTCPQTVWTDLFFEIDRRIDRLLGRKSGAATYLKPIIYSLVAFATAFTFTGLFFDITRLAPAAVAGVAPPAAYAAMAVLSFTTYVFAAHVREGICLHMCPWPRFQAAFLDTESLVVTYHRWRGEPRDRARVPLRLDLASVDLREHYGASPGQPDRLRGDCVDCSRCVNVCPTKIDIRDGLQMGCIGCGLCIDACNTVMKRIGRPEGLVRLGPEASADMPHLGPPPRRYLRGRPLYFGAVALAAGSSVAYGLATRSTLEVSIEPQRQPPFVTLADGSIRNDYNFRVAHLGKARGELVFAIPGQKEAMVRIAGANGAHDGISWGNHRSISGKILVTFPRALAPRGRVPVTILMTEREANKPLATIQSYIWGPEERP
ncbi:MAG: cytochrome c oxidase accessory protein CcoG [Hyphomicrobium sp.]|jgi:cytochrome c oxidase accessory protein FixG